MFLLPQAAATVDLNPEGASVAIHGFANVGRYAAVAGQQMNAKVVAVSDISGAIHNSDGLEIEKVGRWVDENRFLEGYPDADFIDGKDIFTLDVDVLVPAAIQGVIHKDNAADITAKVIIEGANNPTTLEADDILRLEVVDGLSNTPESVL